MDEQLRYRDILGTQPNELTDQDLLKIPLSTLSKNLNPRLSSTPTVLLYLRWLELHRVRETKFTEGWSNTILHWCQALKNRGFLEQDLLREVNKWKENKDLRSTSRRYPPSTKDIAKAYGAESPATQLINKENMKDSEINPQGAMFAGSPPRGYICNRCGKKGHHLQVCPTNLDPTYDRPPDASYQCTRCFEFGKHFKSICPRNTDPNSITQKRKALELQSNRAKTGLKLRESQKRELDLKYGDLNTSSKPDTVKRQHLGVSTKTVESIVSRWTVKNPYEINLDVNEEVTPPNLSRDSPFYLDLMRRHATTLNMQVNKIKNRKTAMQMWDEVDDERSKSLVFSEVADSYHNKLEGHESGRLTPYGPDDMEISSPRSTVHVDVEVEDEFRRLLHDTMDSTTEETATRSLSRISISPSFYYAE